MIGTVLSILDFDYALDNPYFHGYCFIFIKILKQHTLAKPHDSGSTIDTMYFTSSSKKCKIVYWRRL